MENYPIDLAPQEVILTYRQEEAVQPIVLRYECPLPERMRREPEEDIFQPAYGGETDEYVPRATRKKRKKRLVIGLSLLLALILTGVGLWYVQWYALDDSPSDESKEPAEDPDTESEGEEPYFYWDTGDLPEGETTIDTYRPYGGSAAKLELTGADGLEIMTPGDIYNKLWPSTVAVLGEQEGGYSVGTGIIFSADGYILTNYHVISGCSACQVWVPNEYGADQEYEAKLVGGDADQDLAVLKIEAQDLPVARFGVSDDLKVGDNVYAIGNPLGVELRGTFTDGIVSAVNRDVDVEGITMTLIQTNAALNSGNSGGPLVNQYGQVVGINTIKMMSGYDTIEGLGFAIPTSLCVRWVNEIIETGEIQPQPALGLSIDRIPVTLPDGTLALQVVTVVPGLGAEKAGILVGDCVVAFNGQSVYRTEDVLTIRRELHVGDKVPIRVWRGGEYLDLTIEMMAQ